MKHGRRYNDDNDSNLQEVEDYTSDYYENQPGDVISNATKHRRVRKKNPTALGLLLLGTVLVLGGIIFAMIGKSEERSSPLNVPEPVPTQPPTAESTTLPPPTEAVVDAIVTMAPTHTAIYDYIVTLVGEAVLKDTTSLAYRALSWLEETHDAKDYENDRLKQRFALACLYFSTTTQSSQWINSDSWMSMKSECLWYGVQCSDHKLVALNLTANGLEGLVPWEITLLNSNLLSLTLSQNDLLNGGEELAWIGELTNLRLLDVEKTFFSYDGIPPYISQLAELKILDMSEALFVGDLDGSIFSPLTQLLYLELGGNLFNTTLPQEISSLPNLEALYVYDNGLQGDLSFVSDMSKIVELWMDENVDLTGTIPTTIGLLTNLMSLSITNCDLSGQIPTEIGQLTMMEQMWFYGNWLTGSIPNEILQLTNLKILGLEDNNITDTVMPQGLCDREMIALSADCDATDVTVDCACCTCCQAPCPIVNLPTYDSTRLLEVKEEIRRLI